MQIDTDRIQPENSGNQLPFTIADEMKSDGNNTYYEESRMESPALDKAKVLAGDSTPKDLETTQFIEDSTSPVLKNQAIRQSNPQSKHNISNKLSLKSERVITSETRRPQVAPRKPLNIQLMDIKTLDKAREQREVDIALNRQHALNEKH